MAAPICHVSKDQVITQPEPKKLPAIPHATDLQSALKAIAALKQIVEHITQVNVANNFGSLPPKPQKVGRWNQLTRETEKVKVTNPNDPSQFVEIERIKSLTMVDNITKEQWVWKR